MKHDSSAIVAVTYDSKAQVVRLVFHRTFQPSPDDPLDFEATIEATLLDLGKRFQVRKVLFDPYQMVASARRLTKAGLRVEEFAQTVPNLTAASQQLYELIQGLVLYPDAAMRLAMTRTVAVETSRGWRISVPPFRSKRGRPVRQGKHSSALKVYRCLFGFIHSPTGTSTRAKRMPRQGDVCRGKALTRHLSGTKKGSLE